MLITALRVTNYKGARNVVITPGADLGIILIGGRNQAGKSSTVDALTALFGGAKQIADDPVFHGSDQAVIVGELDGGEIVVRRTIAPDGQTQLEVRDRDGAVRRPQDRLDRLIGARFLDPIQFLRKSAKEQRAELMRLIPDAARLADLDAKRERAFDRRRELGREVTKARGEIERLAVVEVGTPVDVAALAAEQRAFGEQQRAGEALGAAGKEKQRIRNDRARELAQLQDQLNQLRQRAELVGQALTTAENDLNAADARIAAAGAAWAATAARRDEIDATLATANAHNQAVFAAQAQNDRLARAGAELERLDAEHAGCTETVVKIDTRKAEILAAARLPVAGLEVGDDGIRLGGVPLAQVAASQQIRVALGLAIAAAPGLDDIWIRDGALLDMDALADLAEQAAAAGKRLWIERVGTRDPGAIIIRDGEVAGRTPDGSP